MTTTTEPRPRGYLALVLHAHLPYVRHPEHPRFLEEAWLFEAITESYIPLLGVCERLAADGVAFRLALSLSPTLTTMLRDPLLQARYLDHGERLLALAEGEVRRTRDDPRLNALARFYRERLADTLGRFRDRYAGDLVAAFAGHARAGRLELFTCAATHGYLPLLRTQPQAVRAQLRVAADHHEALFGAPARGVWLPECGYYPGLESEVAGAGFRWFVVDAHGLLNASRRPRHGLSAPIACPNGVAAFARTPEVSRQVWSAGEGYPGDPDYREFHRDIGHELPAEHLAPFLAEGEGRAATGLKYHRVTGPGRPKEPYDPERAGRRARDHGAHFVALCAELNRARGLNLDRPPLVTAPYDAELFGHWWYEGPQWLEAVVRRAAREPGELELLTPGDYLARHPTLQVAQPAPSSWGEHGYNGVWLNPDTAWVYPHLHRAARRVIAAAGEHGDAPPGSMARRALAQAARSLLLAQASDWPFILHNATVVAYAERRLRDHLARCAHLLDALERSALEPRELAALEYLDAIFPDLRLAHFR